MNCGARALGSVLCAVSLCLLAGCAAGPDVRPVPPAPAGAPELPVYRLRVGDELEVRFLTDESLTVQTPVTPGGTVTIPVIGDVAAAGKTVGELRRDVEAAMSSYLLDATASVVVTKLAGQPVFVIGEVQRPGRVDTLGDLTVARAVAASGGLLPSARTGSVMVLRTVGVPEPAAFKVDLADVLAGRDVAGDMLLVPNDVVYVPKSVIGKVDEFVHLFFEEIMPAQLSFLYGYQMLHAQDLTWVR